MEDVVKVIHVMGVVIGVLVVAMGCRQEQPRQERPRDNITLEDEIDPIALRAALNRYNDNTLTRMIGTASDIAAKTRDRSIREDTLQLKIRVLHLIRLINQEPDPRQQFLASWIITAQARYYLCEGQGADRFGDYHDLMLNLLTEQEAKIIQIGYDHFSRDSIDAAKDDVAALASKQIMAAMIFEENYQTQTPTAKGGDLEAIVGIPMSPVAGLQGIGDTPAAIGKFTQVADRFATIVKDSPEMTRWQLELLLLDIEDSRTMVQLLSVLARFQESVEKIATTVEELPQEVREQMHTGLAEVERMQPQIQETLVQTQRALELTDTTVKSIDVSAQSLTQTADSIDSAAGTIAGIISDVKSMQKPPDPNKKPFDIERYVVLSENVDRSVSELRLLLTDLNQSISTNGGLGQIGPGLKDLVNMLTLRAVMLIVLFFAGLVVYRMMSLRLARR